MGVWTLDLLTDATGYSVSRRPDSDVTAALELVGGCQLVVSRSRQRQSSWTDQTTSRHVVHLVATARRTHHQSSCRRLQTCASIHCKYPSNLLQHYCSRIIGDVRALTFTYFPSFFLLPPLSAGQNLSPGASIPNGKEADSLLAWLVKLGSDVGSTNFLSNFIQCAQVSAFMCFFGIFIAFSKKILQCFVQHQAQIERVWALPIPDTALYRGRSRKPFSFLEHIGQKSLKGFTTLSQLGGLWSGQFIRYLTQFNLRFNT